MKVSVNDIIKQIKGDAITTVEANQLNLFRYRPSDPELCGALRKNRSIKAIQLDEKSLLGSSHFVTWAISRRLLSTNEVEASLTVIKPINNKQLANVIVYIGQNLFDQLQLHLDCTNISEATFAALAQSLRKGRSLKSVILHFDKIPSAVAIRALHAVFLSFANLQNLERLAFVASDENDLTVHLDPTIYELFRGRTGFFPVLISLDLFMEEIIDISEVAPISSQDELNGLSFLLGMCKSVQSFYLLLDDIKDADYTGFARSLSYTAVHALKVNAFGYGIEGLDNLVTALQGNQSLKTLSLLVANGKELVAIGHLLTQMKIEHLTIEAIDGETTSLQDWLEFFKAIHHLPLRSLDLDGLMDNEDITQEEERELLKEITSFVTRPGLILEKLMLKNAKFSAVEERAELLARLARHPTIRTFDVQQLPSV